MTLRPLQNSLPVLACLMLAACGDRQAAASANAHAERLPSAADEAPVVTNLCPPDAAIVLRGTLYGAIERELIAYPASTECDGMARPGNTGVRLTFRTRDSAETGALLAIIGVDTLTPGGVGDGIRSTLTVIDERANRFYSTGRNDICYSDIDRHRFEAEQRRSYIQGVLWCTAAIPAINDASSIRVTELFFNGTTQWQPSGS